MLTSKNFDHHYTLIIETLHENDSAKKGLIIENGEIQPAVRVELAADKTSIGNFFDTDGYFYEEDFEDTVKEMLSEFETKCSEKASETKKTK